ncbi:NEW3 domain-containing protein [Halalkalibacter urbisdiaboli]|uniref:COG1470 family protein n=1 Tax=Halalkalibacter urbisdiaboli TaxID=1960589 RepID=UPI000B447EE0|nr:NEW3 domain-containing protein [Halalkalibacter urbisdiaboli]
MIKKFVLLFTLVAVLVTNATSTFAADLILYTPYTGISVTPGESIDYSFDLINETNSVKHVSFEIEDLPKGWDYTILSSGWNVNQLSIKPNDSATFNANVEVPLNVEKGDYRFYVTANSTDGLSERLPITVNVSEKGTFKTELSSEQPNMEGHADSSFTYDISLINRTAEEQHYSLTAAAPRGWDVNFQIDGNSVTSVTAESNVTKDIKVAVTPPEGIEAGEYSIPIKAATNSTSADLNLEAVITGKYAVELSTPTGRLSEEITAGKEKTIELVVTNTGTAALHDITLQASQPVGWEVEFEPTKINVIEPGKSEKLKATLTASSKAIAGDYVVKLDATSPEASSSAELRMQVETSMLWGWIAVLIIAGVIVGIYYLMRKYGRR